MAVKDGIGDGRKRCRLIFETAGKRRLEDDNTGFDASIFTFTNKRKKNLNACFRKDQLNLNRTRLL